MSVGSPQRLERIMPRHNPFLGLLIATLLTALTGCASPMTVSDATATHPPATDTPEVQRAVVSFPASAAITLSGRLYGAGARGVILSNEGDNVSSHWAPIAERLAAAGYLTLTYDYHRPASADTSSSEALLDLRGAMAFMRGHHVTALALIGSSLGGLVSLKQASLDSVTAVVAISSPIEWEDVRLSESDLARLTAPKFFVTSEENEPFTSDTQRMYELTPTPKEQQVYPGRLHGIQLFDDAASADLLLKLLSFLNRTLGSH
jgi:dienelactone hydrolase